MSLAVLIALAATAVLGAVAWARPASRPPAGRVDAQTLAAALAALALGATAILAVATDGSRAPELGATLSVVAAAAGGGPLAAAILRLGPAASDGPAAAALRGGATIGVLERTAVCATLLAGLPAGVAVVMAVKALGRYPELREPGTSERFIIGTFASVLWAAACAGAAVLALG